MYLPLRSLPAPVGNAPYTQLLLHPSRDLRAQEDIVKISDPFIEIHESWKFLSIYKDMR